MKIFVSAAEISSDLQAEKILSALQKLYPEGSVKLAGIGGPKLRAIPGFHCIQEAETLRAMGFAEVLTKLTQIKKALQLAQAFIEAFKPDLIITFDYPDFHLKLLKSIHGNPLLKHTVKICGIPPKVWVWRAHRIEKIRTYYDAVWVIFPFEEKLYQAHGVPVIYAGNPLIADLLSGNKVQELASSESHSLHLAVLPGSRDAELKYHLPVIPQTLHRLSQLTGKKIIAEVPVPAGLSISSFQSKLPDSSQVSYVFTQGNSNEVLARNHFGLIKSGTSTLEAAVLGCVPVIFYKTSKTTEWIFRWLIRYSGPVGLPNILLGVKNRKSAVFSEFLGPEATPEALAQSLAAISKSREKQMDLQTQGSRLRASLVPYADVSLEVARRIQEFAAHPPALRLQRKKKLWIFLLSFAWSSLNAFRRALYRSGLLRSVQVETPSVLVGNLQAGGAGKTPVVIEIAKQAVLKGKRVGVISRGYGGSFKERWLIVTPEDALKVSAEQIGDEPAEILEAVPEITLGLGADRVKLTHELEKLGINFLIFDDGFQNLKFKAQKTLLIVTDARRCEMIYRDFAGAVKEADLVLLSKGRRDGQWPEQAVLLEWEALQLPEKAVWLFCAVADPSEVANFYQNLGVRIQKTILWPDHSSFEIGEVLELQEAARREGCLLAVTPKDAVKLKSANFPSLFILRRKIKNTGWLELLFKS
ncbi:MAG: tetraacyldisaccharide 4'-kinase [Bdellovibrionales bacterium]|nr:tetraacyldisaccharide 4'-kinase [Oligoflexia bacterium]